jgi:UDP-N-acetylmuramoylalanine--D-glutamate ligase
VSKANYIVVLGGGESGLGAAVLAKLKGHKVFLSDSKTIADKYKTQLQDYVIEFEEGGHTEERILNAGEIIKSPGIPDTASLIVAAREKGISVISEIEFASRYTQAKIIAITGSNGKTTTTLLTYHMLQKAGLNVGLAGNVGNSFAFQVATKEFDYYVLELSSFQLDGIKNFKADIAVLLNITPDHLDRYAYSFDNYIQSKLQITKNQGEQDCFVFCNDDPQIIKNLGLIKTKGKHFPFSTKSKLGEGAHLDNTELHIQTDNNTFSMSIHELALQGKHNVYNSMAAGITSKLLNLRQEVIRESLTDFQAVEHRLEPVLHVHGIQFINDSKATNVNATWYALESMSRPVVWIVGGVDKGNDYAQLQPLVKEHVKAIICLGKNNAKIHHAFEDLVEVIVDAANMQEAVRMAYALGRKEDAVLLSPACASFDLFENYEDRGQQFKQYVKEL